MLSGYRKNCDVAKCARIGFLVGTGTIFYFIELFHFAEPTRNDIIHIAERLWDRLGTPAARGGMPRTKPLR